MSCQIEQLQILDKQTCCKKNINCQNESESSIKKDTRFWLCAKIGDTYLDQFTKHYEMLLAGTFAALSDT